MDRRLAPDREAPEPVRIGIAAEQQRLIDEHRAVPHHRRAAEPRQHPPPNPRLAEEKQELGTTVRQTDHPAPPQCGGGRSAARQRTPAHATQGAPYTPAAHRGACTTEAADDKGTRGEKG